MSEISKEELLDIKNIKLLKEMKGAFDNKIEIKRLAEYIRKSPVKFCQIEQSNVFPNATWRSTRMLVDIIEMMKKGKIIFKEE